MSDIEYVSDDVARVTRGGRRQLVVSVGAPFRARDESGDKAPVSLDLVARPDHFRPENPVVDLRLPRRLSDGVDFGPELSFEPELGPGAGTPEGVAVEGGVWFHQTHADTDFFLKPLTGGIESFVLLRSQAAPREPPAAVPTAP